MIQACNSLLNTVVAPDMKVMVNSFPWQHFFSDKCMTFGELPDILLTAVTFCNYPSFREKWSPCNRFLVRKPSSSRISLKWPATSSSNLSNSKAESVSVCCFLGGGNPAYCVRFLLVVNYVIYAQYFRCSLLRYSSCFNISDRLTVVVYTSILGEILRYFMWAVLIMNLCFTLFNLWITVYLFCSSLRWCFPLAVLWSKWWEG